VAAASSAVADPPRHCTMRGAGLYFIVGLLWLEWLQWIRFWQVTACFKQRSATVAPQGMVSKLFNSVGTSSLRVMETRITRA
jgi:hypothetical protein